MKVAKIFSLFILSLCYATSSAFPSRLSVIAVEPLEDRADFVIYKDAKGVHAKVGSRWLARGLGKGIGSIAFTTVDGSLTTAELFQRVFYILHERGGGVVFVRQGIYDLGKEGFEIPFSTSFRLEGEGIDRTVFTYSGSDTAIAVGGKKLWGERGGPSHNNWWIMRDFTIRVEGDCVYAMRLLQPNYGTVERVKILARKGTKPKCGVSVEVGNTNLKVVRKVRIEGPFEVGLRSTTDHFTAIDIVVKGFRKIGIRLGGVNRLFGAELLAEKGAIAGISDWDTFEGELPPLFFGNIAAWYWNWREGSYMTPRDLFREGFDTSPIPVSNLVDETPPMEGYNTVLAASSSFHVHLRRCKLKEPFRTIGGEVLEVDSKLWERVCPVIPSHIDEDVGLSPDLVVFKDDKYTKLQVASERIAEAIGAPIGAIVAQVDRAEDEQKVFELALHMLPKGGVLRVKQGTYNVQNGLKIPWGKDIAIDGDLPFVHFEAIELEGLRKRGIEPKQATAFSGKDLISFEKVPENPKRFDRFILRHVNLSGCYSGTALHLVGTKAVVKDVVINPNTVYHPDVRPIVIEKGSENIIMTLFSYGFEMVGKIGLDDHGERSFIINAQVQGRAKHLIRLGKNSIIIGAHPSIWGVPIDPETRKEMSGEKMEEFIRSGWYGITNTKPLGKEGIRCVLFGVFFEEIHPKGYHCLFADNGEVYVFGLQHDAEVFGEANGGKIVFLK
jgi:hypothetical protein